MEFLPPGGPCEREPAFRASAGCAVTYGSMQNEVTYLLS